MKTLGMVVSLAICLSLGCEKSEDSSPVTDDILATTFHVSAKKLVDNEELVVFRINIEAAGERNVWVSAQGRVFCEGLCVPDPKTDTLQYEVILVATLIKRSGSSNFVKWFMQTEGGGSKISRPSPETIETEAEALSEILNLKTIEGPVSFGNDLVLGEFKHEPIVVLVK
jgi:hypothetical protein